MNELKAALSKGLPLVADGATGTWLQQAGLSAGTAPELWTLENPDAIRQLAADYLTAGSDIIYTNTFGANRIRLRLSGLEEKIGQTNRYAARLARESIAKINPAAFLVASIGPTGEMLEPYGDLEPDEAREAFVEQISILASEGVDGFACETFGAMEEALLCVSAVKEVAPGLPVFASMAFDTSGCTMMGVTPEQAVTALFGAGADVIGANCSVGPDVVLAALEAMRMAAPAMPLLAKPNAGLPVLKNGHTSYPITPGEMGLFASRAVELGALVIGGCCGSTPLHIRAIKESIRS
jgi:5-methyltetrahydrofolate--homocysteine methyltransferase